MNPFYEQFNDLIASQEPFVMVTLVDALGSVPQEPGAKMLVTAEGLFCGTVGGGKVEKRAIEEALQLLAEKNPGHTHFVEWHLQRDIGMTCGGSMKFYFEVFNLKTWQIVIFGAGHVAQALIPMLLKLDCRVTCIDSRSDWLAKLPDVPQLTRIENRNMPDEVAALPDDAFVLLMTMGHTTDKPVLLEIFKTGKPFPYLGVIGSRAKAARLKKDIEDAGLPESFKEAFYCPVGLELGNNHPQEIAISIAAQLLQVRDTSSGQ